jgi:hypothetical protein
MSRGWLFTVARPGGASRGVSRTLERGGGESAEAIPRFLCGSPHMCRLRPRRFGPDGKPWVVCWSHIGVFLWDPISQVAFVTTWSNHTSLLHVVLLLLEGEWDRGPRLHPVSRDPISTYYGLVNGCHTWEPPGVKRMTCWSGSFPVWCISIRVTATLSVMSDILLL